MENARKASLNSGRVDMNMSSRFHNNTQLGQYQPLLPPLHRDYSTPTISNAMKTAADQEHEPYLRATHETPDLSKVRLTNSEILRAQYLKKKHHNATPNYLSYRHQDTNHDLALNTVDGNLVPPADIRQRQLESHQRLRRLQ